MEDWIDEYIKKFKITEFDKKQVLECLERIVYKLRTKSKFEGLELNFNLYKGHISLPDCNIHYTISDKSIQFYREDEKELLYNNPPKVSAAIIIYRKNVIIVYRKETQYNSPMQAMSFQEFNLNIAINKVLRYLLTNKYTNTNCCVGSYNYYR